jgi:hypothetical protein
MQPVSMKSVATFVNAPNAFWQMSAMLDKNVIYTEFAAICKAV